MKKKTGEILFGLIVILFVGFTAQAANFTASADGEYKIGQFGQVNYKPISNTF